MPTILKTKSIYYNDCVLVSQNPGKVKSRSDIPRKLDRIIVAPMTSIIGKEFALEAAKGGISICIPRFASVQEKCLIYNIFNRNKMNDEQLCFISIGLNEKEEDLDYIIHNTTTSDSFLIDIAFAGVPQLEDSIAKLSELFILKNLMIGNIMSGTELRRLSGFNKYCNNLFVRLGCAGGSACATSDRNGFGRGQITEQMECFDVKKELNNNNLFIIGDGGIKNSGYAMKAFGAGCDYSMMGRYFVDAIEAKTNINGDGEYWGLASDKQIKLSNLNKIHNEGKVLKLNKEHLKPLKDLIEELWCGISSGISYSGYENLNNYIGNGIFEIKENSLPPKNRN